MEDILFLLYIFYSNKYFLRKKIHLIKIDKTINILIIVALSIFIIKNISRLQHENEKYQYNLFTNPYLIIRRKNFHFQKIFSKLNFNYRKKMIIII